MEGGSNPQGQSLTINAFLHKRHSIQIHKIIKGGYLFKTKIKDCSEIN